MKLMPGSIVEFGLIPEDANLLFIPQNSLYFKVMMKTEGGKATFVCLTEGLEQKGGIAIPNDHLLKNNSKQILAPFTKVRILGAISEVRKIPPQEKSNLVYLGDHLIAESCP